MLFDKKTAVITGGAGVLCSAFGAMLAREGARVALLDLNAEAAAQRAAEIERAGGRAIGVGCNVLEPASVNAAAKEVADAFGACDFLINGAGGNNPKGSTAEETYGAGTRTFFDIDSKDFAFVTDLNLLGTVIPTQVFAKQMLGREGSSILNISSMSAPCPMTKVPAYSAAKAGISNLTQWLAVYFADSKIRVNAIAPGFLITGQNRALLLNDDGSLTERSRKIISHTPMRRFGQPSELLGAVKFLLNYSESAFVNGIVLPIDGGFMAYSGV
ncbi:MAG: SDR family oxidoreductase [Clostridiales bacterium]|jgi:NAD(P)-dependent dehydrogenase (short-subunit alcohol dehydrogenase family)|nr:SDR family oxidoreductase [Clostridiales bacterium]